jgi:hypothetical protein
MRLLSYPLIALVALASAPQLVCQTAVSEPVRGASDIERFGQPIRQIFEPFFRMTRELPTPFDSAPHYKVTVEDPLWQWVYVRIAQATEIVSRFIGRLQRGRISIYLMYSFVTLIALLFFTQT